jgi:hypothetical protein
MIRELKRFSVLQTGKILGAVYRIFGVIMIPFILIGAILNPGGIGEMMPLIVMAVLYPIIGFISGIFAAAAYNNVVAKWVGGLRFTVEDVE